MCVCWKQKVASKRWQKEKGWHRPFDSSHEGVGEKLVWDLAQLARETQQWRRPIEHAAAATCSHFPCAEIPLFADPARPAPFWLIRLCLTVLQTRDLTATSFCHFIYFESLNLLTFKCICFATNHCWHLKAWFSLSFSCIVTLQPADIRVRVRLSIINLL